MHVSQLGTTTALTLLAALGGWIATHDQRDGEPRPERASPAARSANQEEEPGNYLAFVRAFDDAADAFNNREVERLLGKYEEWGQRHALDVMRRLAWEPSETIIDRGKVVRLAWKEVYDNTFLTKVEKAFANMPRPLRQERTRLLDAWDEAMARYIDVAGKPKGKERNGALKEVGIELEGLAGAFEECGDLYYASLSFAFAGASHDTHMVGEKDANSLFVARNYARLVELRERLDLETPWLESYRARLAELEELGIKGDVSAEEAAELDPGITLGPGSVLDGTFTLLDEPTAIERPNFSTDLAYVTWSSVWLGVVDSEGTFSGQDPSPVLKRVSAAEVQVTGTDGEVQEIPLTGKITLVETTTGDPPRPFAFLMQIGRQGDFFHEFEVNLEPSSESLNLYVCPAGGMTTVVDETPVTVYDDNLDGTYGSAPLSYGYAGLAKGEFQPDIDTVRIGKAKRALPWSEYLRVEDTWYQFEPIDGGKAFRVAPAEILTGTLELDYEGPDPSWMIVRGMDNLEQSYFDLAADKEVEVPVGRYQLFYGGFRRGKRGDAMEKAIVLPPLETRVWTVTEGETTVVELGEPYDMDFEFTANEERVTVIGNSITLTGRGGERYHRLWSVRLKPELMLRKEGKGKGSKAGRLILVSDPETLNTEGYEKAWKPLDLEIENRFGGDPVELRMIEKKNRLFGKIESSWRKPK